LINFNLLATEEIKSCENNK